jgi:hypothetical protein
VGTRFLGRLVLPSLALVAAAAIVAGPAGADPAVPSLPSSGAFVIGDGNTTPGTPVTFWGAQWWKNNAVSKSDIPPSFKGFASAPSANPCDGPFTTEPGNSSNPPDGPLPSLMIALVTDTVTKSGSTISGTVIGLAVIATDPGYDDNPGHEGTGTVMTFIPCSGPNF